jgi:hypothetical protein
MTTVLNERKLRRIATIDYCEPITLDDGQIWFFPRPVISAAARQVVVRDDGSIDVVMSPTGFESHEFTDDYLAKVEALCMARYIGEEQQALAELAVDLLKRNYNLEPSDFRRLLSFPISGDYAPYWEKIRDVAIGTSSGPKPMPIGSSASSPQTE